jgi:hypothetical protein
MLRNVALALTMAVVVAWAFGAGAVRAAEIDGVEFPETKVMGSHLLKLNGVAMRTAFFFDVYAAGLYLPEKTSDAQAILAADAPRHTDMRFVRNVDAANIAGAWLDGLAANTPDAAQELQEKFATLNGWMEDMAPGQSMSFTWLPGQGTGVRVKGSLKGVIEGKDFADALFRCWIGSNPGPGTAFKEDLLGR